MKPTNKNDGRIQSVSWGVPCFDEITKGIPANDLSIIETSNYRSGMIVLGKFLYEGLMKGEKCAMITFDSTTVFLENFLKWNMEFQKYLDSEQFIFLNYKPNVGAEVGLTYSYDILFEEINRLCGDKPSRIAFHQIDALISLNNLVLMNTCAQKLTAAAHATVGTHTTILGQFVQFGDKVHRDLSIACQKTMAGFFSLASPHTQKPEDVIFSTKKLPWFGYKSTPSRLCLKEGEGFVKETHPRSEAA